MADKTSVDDYINAFSGETKKRLNTLRALVKSLAPDAVESFSYGLAGYKLNGRPLVYFGAFRSHIGLYPTPEGADSFSHELSKYKVGKGSIQLPLDQELPIELVARIINHRKERIEA